jgi:hypothetical protein
MLDWQAGTFHFLKERKPYSKKILCELWVLFVECPIVFMVQIKRIKYAASHMRVTIHPEERRLQFPV